jgi:hypothetical protein
MPRCRYSTVAAVAFDGARLPGGYCRSYVTVKEEKWHSVEEAAATEEAKAL